MATEVRRTYMLDYDLSPPDTLLRSDSSDEVSSVGVSFRRTDSHRHNLDVFLAIDSRVPRQDGFGQFDDDMVVEIMNQLLLALGPW